MRNRPRRPGSSRGLWVVTGLIWLILAGPAGAQVVWGRGARPPRVSRGTYGPGMSFGSFGYRMNYGYALGNPYGGLGGRGYGFGSGVGPGFAPGGSVVYSSAYNTPGTGPGFAGAYPPFAAYGFSNRNPAVFPPGSPNDPVFRRVVVPPASGVAPRPWRRP